MKRVTAVLQGSHTHAMKLRHAFPILTASILIPAAFAQEGRGTVYFGGGPMFPTNRIGNFIKDGFNLSAGGGLRATRTFELLGEFDYARSGVLDSRLAQLNVPNGNARMYSVTGNLKINLIPGPVNLYAIGGGGWYRRTVEFTQPTTAVVPFFDPWFGFFGQAVVPANQVLGSFTLDAGGVNAGGGLAFRISHNTRIYAEARVHRAYTHPTNTTIVPLTFGIRF